MQISIPLAARGADGATGLPAADSRREVPFRAGPGPTRAAVWRCRDLFARPLVIAIQGSSRVDREFLLTGPRLLISLDVLTLVRGQSQVPVFGHEKSRLVAAIDTQPTASPAYSCNLEVGPGSRHPEVILMPASASRPSYRAVLGPCGTVSVQVGTHKEPALEDRGALASLVSQILTEPPRHA